MTTIPAVHRVLLALVLVAALSPSPARPADPERHAPGDALPTYTIGALLPLSGDAAWFGKVMRAGMELAVDEIQEGFGFRFRLAVEDLPSARPSDAEAAFAKLMVGERAVAVFTASATPTLAVLPRATRERVLLVHGGVVSDQLVGASPLLFHTRLRRGLLGEAAAAWAREQRVRRLAVLASGDAVGGELRERLAEAWRRRGRGPLAEARLLVDSPDLETRLRGILRSAPEAIVLAFPGPEWGGLAATLRDLGYRDRLLALDDAPEAVLVAGAKAEGVEVLAEVFAAPPEGEASRAGRFASAYRAKYGADPERYAANAYEAVHLLAAALAGLPSPLEGAAKGDRLRQALLAGQPYPSVYDGVVRLQEDGTLIRPLALLTVAGGTLTFRRYLDPSG